MEQPTDIYDRHAVKLMQMGYHPVPVAPLGFETDKCPVRWDPHSKQFFKFKNWNTLPPVMDPQPGANIGALMGGAIVGLDYDHDDGALIISEVLPDSPVNKVDERGWTSFYRVETAILCEDFYNEEGELVLQILGTGKQTVLPPSIHRKTKQPYRWTNGHSLYDTPVEQLPLLPADYRERILKLGFQTTRPSKPKPDKRLNNSDQGESDGPYAELNQVAIRNLAKWVPQLNIYKLRRQRGQIPSYEGVAQWRQSIGGRGMPAAARYACRLHSGKQMTLAQSSKRLIEDKIEAFNVGNLFRVYDEKIRTPGDGLIIFQGLQDHTAESIKSLEGYRIAWIEEAQSLSQRSLALLRPTIRAEGSQIWASWNPRRKTDAVDEFFRQRRPDNAIIVHSSWRDNPWFTPELEEERQLDLKLYPERYDHIWEGEYAKAFEGAYFAKQLAQAKAEGRIGNVGADPMLPYKAFFDLGGTGARADALAIWIAQFVGREIRVLDYIEGVGQEVGYYVSELRKRKYDQALLVLPHDGNAHHGPIHKTYKDHFQDAGFEVDVIPNQGAGAATLRVEAARRIFPRCWFNEKTTQAGIEALGFYHERRDEARNIGLGPEHDWSSHGCDAFGLMAVVYEEPRVRAFRPKRDDRPSRATHWSA